MTFVRDRWMIPFLLNLLGFILTFIGPKTFSLCVILMISNAFF